MHLETVVVVPVAVTWTIECAAAAGSDFGAGIQGLD